MSPQPKKKVLVCVPSGDGTNRTELTKYLVHLAFRGLTDPTFEWTFGFEFVLGCSPVEYARNELVRNFHKSNADLLWFIDADMVPLEGSHLTLMAPYDVTFGPCPMFIQAGSGRMVLTANVFSAKEEDGSWRTWTPDDVDPIAGGTANMVVRRKVLEDPRMWVDEDKSVFRRDYEAGGKIRQGEDVDFCQRARECGYTTGCVMGAKTDHVKPLAMDLVVQTVLSQIDEHQRS